MKIKINTILPLFGMAAFFGGILNGTLGTGAGIIFTFLFSLLYEKDENKQKKDVFASCLVSTLPVCLISAFMYSKSNPSLLNDSIPYLFPACAGGIAGALLLNRINNRYLGKLFAVLTGLSGVMMICKALW